MTKQSFCYYCLCFMTPHTHHENNPDWHGKVFLTSTKQKQNSYFKKVYDNV